MSTIESVKLMSVQSQQCQQMYESLCILQQYCFDLASVFFHCYVKQSNALKMASNNSALCNIGLHLFDVVKTIGKLGCILNGAMELLELKIKFCNI